MVYKIFWFCLTILVREKFKKSIFEIPIITQSSNIINLRTTSATPINLHMISKLVEYSLKDVVTKAMFLLTVLEILQSKGRSELWPT